MGVPRTHVQLGRLLSSEQRDQYFIAEEPAPAPHLAHPEGCAAMRIVLVNVPRVNRSCEHFPDGFDLHLLYPRYIPKDVDLPPENTNAEARV